MTILIAKRGNISGPNPSRENTWTYIQEALDAGYYVECDLWVCDNQFFLGHDEPQEKIDITQLENPCLFLHAKDIVTMHKLSEMFYFSDYSPDVFFHQNDDLALTKKGLLWTFPGKTLTPTSIAVLPENVIHWFNLENAAGICSDYIERYKNGRV